MWDFCEQSDLGLRYLALCWEIYAFYSLGGIYNAQDWYYHNFSSL